MARAAAKATDKATDKATGKPAAKAAATSRKPAGGRTAAKGAPRKRPEYASKLFAEGLAVRRAVLGADYVDSSIANASEFMVAFQKLVTEYCWGEVWTRPGLSRKQRSMLNLAMLTALNRPNELRLHLRGALTNGVSRDEIKEILLQACIYAGIPAGLDAFKVAEEVFREIDST
jgi:4-carboxymuconolactone decarboxylase